MDLEAVRFILAAPCGNCPFLKAGLGGINGLRRDRVKEIHGNLVGAGNCAQGVFVCHKSSRRRVANRLHCAGAAVYVLKQKKTTVMMRLAEQLLGWNPREFLRRNGTRVVGSLREFEKVQAVGRARATPGDTP